MDTEATIQDRRSPGQVLLDLRVKRNWTQPELARRSGVGITTINQAENDKLVPRPLTQARIAKALRVERYEIWPQVQEAAS